MISHKTHDEFYTKKSAEKWDILMLNYQGCENSLTTNMIYLYLSNVFHYKFHYKETYYLDRFETIMFVIKEYSQS